MTQLTHAQIETAIGTKLGAIAANEAELNKIARQALVDPEVQKQASELERRIATDRTMVERLERAKKQDYADTARAVERAKAQQQLAAAQSILAALDAADERTKRATDAMYEAGRAIKAVWQLLEQVEQTRRRARFEDPASPYANPAAMHGLLMASWSEALRVGGIPVEPRFQTHGPAALAQLRKIAVEQVIEQQAALEGLGDE